MTTSVDQRDTFLSLRIQPASWHPVLPYAALLTVTFLLYGTTIYFQFVWDDVVYVTQNYRVQGLSWAHLRAVWTETYLGHYAPVQHTFLAILHHFSGMDPFGYHLGQFLVHAACACLLYFVLTKVESRPVAFLASLLFAIHPANIETVAWVSETKSTLAFLFFLLSFWAFLRLRASNRWRDLIWCALFLILSLLAKINTVVAPAIFLLYEYREGFTLQIRRVASLLVLFLISAAMVVVHLFSFHGTEAVMESSYYGGLLVHLQNMPFLLFFYVRMVIFPHPLSAWQMFRIYDQFTWQVAAAWIGLLGTIWLFVRANRNVQFWGLWFLVFLGPVLQIIPFPIFVADRYLYIPAIGLFVLGARFFLQIWERLAQPSRQLAWGALLCAVLVGYAWHTHSHLPIWRNDQLLWDATVKTCMTSPYCHANHGQALLQAGQTERGVKELIRAVEIRPAPRYLVFLGDAYTLLLRDYRQATIAYDMALEASGVYANSLLYAKQARAYIMAGRLNEARAAIEAGGKKNANDPNLLVVNGFLQWKLGNLEEARGSLRKALAVTGQNSNVAGFLYPYWGNPADIGRLLSDLRASAAGRQTGSSSGPAQRSNGND